MSWGGEGGREEDRGEERGKGVRREGEVRGVGGGREGG